MPKHQTPSGASNPQEEHAKSHWSCDLPGCDGLPYGLGYCRRHWRCFTSYGDPLGVGPNPALEVVRAEMQSALDELRTLTEGEKT